MIRPSTILDGIAKEMGRQAKESTVVFLAIAGLALVSRRLEDRYEARQLAAQQQAEADAPEEVEKPDDLDRLVKHNPLASGCLNNVDTDFATTASEHCPVCEARPA